MVYIVDKTHRISWNLANKVKGDVLAAAISRSAPAMARPKVLRGDKDGLGDHQLVPRGWTTLWGGCAHGEIEG
jgi:hypothetical protein